ncbi:MAG: hypothetical protein RLW68_00535 [Devosia marina]|jgi:hypothetical protein|uniref:DUF6894 domain-containing protein n=1 Tax=Devosia marina TaxID=2683198 RepID=A0A7X3FP10_9HYPH|nr:hypothetical protein [Devosia marina]MVS97682.1 hypothetical protein [Devosia marina]
MAARQGNLYRYATFTPGKRELIVPKYYFHYRTDEALIRDESGSEHPDLDAAEQTAAEMGRAIIEKVAGEGGEMDAPRSIEITDAAGQDLLYVVFWAGPKVGDGPATPIEPATVH